MDGKAGRRGEKKSTFGMDNTEIRKKASMMKYVYNQPHFSSPPPPQLPQTR